MQEQQESLEGTGTAGVAPVRGRGARDWHVWAPYAAVAWSVAYAAMAIYWVASGRGFPYASGTASKAFEPVIARIGPGAAWAVVTMAGIPAAAMGIAMLRGVRGKPLRRLFIAAGLLLTGFLLLAMTDLNLLILLGYTPYAIVGLFTGAEIGRKYLDGLTQWTTIHQVLCLAGGFIWLAATVCYSRRSGDACAYCGRPDGPEGWQSPKRAARWGRTAVYVSMVAPVFYAFTRFAWALGFPLGMSEEFFRRGQERGVWIAGLFLAAFGMVGILLTLGLIQRWGEVFPRWMIGLAGRRVPIMLAVVPASLVSVLLVVGGTVIWSGLPGMAATLSNATGVAGMDLIWDLTCQVGPTLLFPVWGVTVAMAALAYYYRRRGPCSVCGRGAAGDTGNPTLRVLLDASPLRNEPGPVSGNCAAADAQFQRLSR